jgi:hypothetical protein
LTQRNGCANTPYEYAEATFYEIDGFNGSSDKFEQLCEDWQDRAEAEFTFLFGLMTEEEQALFERTVD